MDPMIEPSQEQACNKIMKASKNLVSSSTSMDYIFISNDLENIKYLLIIAVIEERTPNTSMITTIKDL